MAKEKCATLNGYMIVLYCAVLAKTMHVKYYDMCSAGYENILPRILQATRTFC